MGENLSDPTLLLESLTATLSPATTKTNARWAHVSDDNQALDDKNFSIRSRTRMLKMKLSGKDKLGYINGTSPPSATMIGKYSKCNMEDHLIKDYIITMDPSLIGNFLPYQL
jgi:hypothetical protein